MTDPRPTIPDDELQQLFAYHDGELAADDAKALEARLRQSPELARELEALRIAEDGLRRGFEGVGDVAITPEVDVLRVHPFRPLPMRAILALAAAIVVLGVAWVAVQSGVGGGRALQVAQMARVLDGDFEPDVVCDTPEKFLDYTVDRFGVPITADFATPVALIGWTSLDDGYLSAAAAGEHTRVLLARADAGERVIVVFRPAGHLAIEETMASDLHRHTRTIRGIAIDEISTLDAPVVLPLLGEG
ncbi:MAG: hypothetical protein AAFX79_09915 [Planctomycetota bacterium]